MTAPFEFETIPFTGETDFESDMEGEYETRRALARPVARDRRRFGAPRVATRIGRRVAPRLPMARFIPRPQRLARQRAFGWQRFPGYAHTRRPRWWMRRRRYGGIYPTWLPDGTMPSDEPFGADDAPPPPSFGPSLSDSPGGGDERVRWVQSRLNELLGVNLPITGFMGPATRNAVRRFQSQSGLPPDGIVGPPTEQALAQPPQATAPDAGPPPKGPSQSDPTGAPPPAPTPELEFGFGRRSRRRRRRPCRCNYDDQFEWEGE